MGKPKQEPTEVYILTEGKHKDEFGRKLVKGDALELTDKQAKALANKIKPLAEVEAEADAAEAAAKKARSTANKAKQKAETETKSTVTERW